MMIRAWTRVSGFKSQLPVGSVTLNMLLSSLSLRFPILRMGVTIAPLPLLVARIK